MGGFGCWCGGRNGCVWTLKRGLKWVRLGADVGTGMRAETGASKVSIKDKNGDGDVYKEDDQIPSKGKRLFKALLNRRSMASRRLKLSDNGRKIRQQHWKLKSTTI
ncbi:hypothetical protein Tco_1227926 [Tanacetum coccineum]